MFVFRSFLTAILINWSHAELLEFRKSSENGSATQTEKDRFSFWAGYPPSTFRRRQFFQTSSRVRVGEIGTSNSADFVTSRMQKRMKRETESKGKIKIRASALDDKIKSREVRLDDNHSHPKQRQQYKKEKENASIDRWANQTDTIGNDVIDTNSKKRDVFASLRKSRMHKLMRPALLDNLHKTLSKVDEIMRKPHLRRLVQDIKSKSNLRDDGILSTEKSLFLGKSTSYSTTIQTWPKVIRRRKPWEHYEQSRKPKGMDKAIARNNEENDDVTSTTCRMHLVQEARNAAKKDTTTTTASPLGPTLSPYSIKTHLEELASKFSHANVSMEVIGRTVSYNDIVLLKVTEKKESSDKYFRAEDKYLDEGPEKKIVFIVHGLSVMGVHFLPCMLQKAPLEKLVSYYFAHLDKFDIFLIPMANPDGVTMGPSESWNKNTSPQSSCSGVYLDRNFDVMWNNSRTTSSCSQQYPGPSPFSEEETRAVRDVIHRYSHKIVAYLHLHSATYTADVFKGDAVLYPRGYTDVQSDDDRYIDLRGEIDEAMKNATFQVLTVAVDTLYNWYGKVSGTSVDYASSVYGIPYAMELVMQIYMDDPTVQNQDEAESAVALREVWRRVIDAIFHSIHKYLHTAGE